MKTRSVQLATFLVFGVMLGGGADRSLAQGREPQPTAPIKPKRKPMHFTLPVALVPTLAPGNFGGSAQPTARAASTEPSRGECGDQGGRGAEAWAEPPAKRRQKDMGAHWTKKNAEMRYGYKNHLKADAKSKSCCPQAA